MTVDEIHKANLEAMTKGAKSETAKKQTGAKDAPAKK